MEDKLSVINGYKTHIPSIKRGTFNSDSIITKPCVCYLPLTDETTVNFLGGDTIDSIGILMYGYIDVGTYSNDDTAFDTLWDLEKDLEYFLLNDYTYKLDVTIGDRSIYETTPTAAFELLLLVKIY
jgi:hypothetical protein